MIQYRLIYPIAIIIRPAWKCEIRDVGIFYRWACRCRIIRTMRIVTGVAMIVGMTGPSCLSALWRVNIL